MDTQDQQYAGSGRSALLFWWRNPSGLAVAILCLGTFLRFMQMGDIRYSYDHSYPTYQALQWLDGGRLPLLGQPSSIFLDNPVLMTYLQSIPLLVVRSPWSVYVFIIFLNSLAIWFVYSLARDLLGARVGLVAAFLFAVNPWVVFFSRTSWVQALLPLLVAVIAWGIWPRLVDPHAAVRRFFIGCVAVTVLTQTYIQSWGVLPQLILLIILFRRHIPKQAFWAAVGLFLLGALIYIGGLATRWDANVNKLFNFVSADSFTFSTIGMRHALRFVTGADFEQAYASADGAGNVRANLSLAAVVALTIFVIIGAGRAFLAWRRGGRERRIAIVLLLWFCLPALLAVVGGSFQIHPHYLLLTVPAGHLLAAWGIQWLLTAFARSVATKLQLKPLLPIGVLITLVAIGALFAHDLWRANQNVARQPVWPEFDGWSLAAGTEVGRTLQKLLDPRANFPKRIHANGDSSLLSALSGVYLDKVSGIDYPDFVLVSEVENMLYVVEGEAAVAEWLRPFVAARQEQTLSFANGEQVSFLQTKTAAARSVRDHPQETVLWSSEAGLTLIGYTLYGELSPGQFFDLVTYWRVDDLHPDRNEWYISPSYHLVNGQGQIVSNIGEHGQYAHRWQLRDVYIEHISIPIPENALPGLYSLDIGLFDPIRSHAYPFFSREGVENHFSVAVNVRLPG